MAPEMDHEAIKQAVMDKYVVASCSVEGLFRYPIGKAGAVGLDYEPTHIQGAPKTMIERFCGVGNPFSLGAPTPGERVLDIGCGAGFDLYCAATLVAPSGEAWGVDLTPAMVATAQENLALAGVVNANVKEGCVEDLPFGGSSFNLVISNGVLNLSPDKHRCFSEIHRVLRPGGRLQFADIVLQDGGTPQEVSAASWSN